MNNLESCDVLSSTHFKMAAQLLEVIQKNILETKFVCEEHTQAHRSDFFAGGPKCPGYELDTTLFDDKQGECV